GGGHTRRLIEEYGDRIRVIAIDRDPDAVANAADLGATVVLGNFADLGDLVGEYLVEPPAAVLFDFGVSSHQLDDPSRGFSYHQDGPLDMRMGPDARLTAAEIVNQWPATAIADIIRRHGEEPLASRIADAIVSARPIESTARLSTVIAEAMPAARRRAGHPARRTFQAIRIAVNAELEAVASGLDQAIELVRPGGRVIAISYHSLEDRIVKTRFAAGTLGCICPPGLPVCGCGRTSELRLLTRKPVRASAEEIAQNRRARSAVLRAVEKVAA
ncbi:MAG TPA: 16S rRNA (cytosine(1402)-N(4))-methyltransferase RsmH, partial [Acidimicrobiia bacterium]